MAKILQRKIIDFDEKSLLQNPYEMNKYDSLLQKKFYLITKEMNLIKINY